jgi:hypothetical protein
VYHHLVILAQNLTYATGYGPLIKNYVQFILAKLRFHRIRPEFNGLFEYEEYVTLKGIDDPNEGCVSNEYCAVSTVQVIV